MTDKTSGVLLHVSSLPSEFGIGDLGPEACGFVDFLQQTKQQYWQILPINPTDGISGYSPYSSLSAFAGNILFISPQVLVEEGILSENDIKVRPEFSDRSVDFELVVKYKNKLLDQVYENFVSDPFVRREQEESYKDFVAANAFWLDDYALFVTIKEIFPKSDWTRWPEGLRVREEKALKDFGKAHKDKLTKVKFLQYLFFKQWDALKGYCADKGVRLFGDLSIYMNLDSADVWQYPQNYKLDDQFRPLFVAGVPPDYFSKTGQRWGNPVYNWDVLKKARFPWWVMRVQFNFRLFDVIRIDHFRGLVQYWEIPAEEETAVKGHWKDVPTDDLFKAIKKSSSKSQMIIAEDLGYITDDVRDAMKRLGFPGMKILLFAFNGNMQEHPYLPHNYKDRCVVYTGTHDNNTVTGWFHNEALNDEKNNIRQYLEREVSAESIHWDLIELAFNSEAEIAITPMQDLLGLGQEARMNTPGTVGKMNWQWRLLSNELTQEVGKKLLDLTVKTGRA